MLWTCARADVLKEFFFFRNSYKNYSRDYSRKSNKKSSKFDQGLVSCSSNVFRGNYNVQILGFSRSTTYVQDTRDRHSSPVHRILSFYLSSLNYRFYSSLSLWDGLGYLFEYNRNLTDNSAGFDIFNNYLRNRSRIEYSPRFNIKPNSPSIHTALPDFVKKCHRSFIRDYFRNTSSLCQKFLQ